MRNVLITYKTDPNTGFAYRPDFTTTDANIEDHERLFGDKIKDIKFVGSAISIPIVKKETQVVEPTNNNVFENKIKEQNIIISNQAAAITTLEKEIEELKRPKIKRPQGRPRKEFIKASAY